MQKKCTQPQTIPYFSGERGWQTYQKVSREDKETKVHRKPHQIYMKKNQMILQKQVVEQFLINISISIISLIMINKCCCIIQFTNKMQQYPQILLNRIPKEDFLSMSLKKTTFSKKVIQFTNFFMNNYVIKVLRNQIK